MLSVLVVLHELRPLRRRAPQRRARQRVRRRLGAEALRLDRRRAAARSTRCARCRSAATARCKARTAKPPRPSSSASSAVPTAARASDNFQAKSRVAAPRDRAGRPGRELRALLRDLLDRRARVRRCQQTARSRSSGCSYRVRRRDRRRPASPAIASSHSTAVAITNGSEAGRHDSRFARQDGSTSSTRATARAPKSYVTPEAARRSPARGGAASAFSRCRPSSASASLKRSRQSGIEFREHRRSDVGSIGMLGHALHEVRTANVRRRSAWGKSPPRFKIGVGAHTLVSPRRSRSRSGSSTCCRFRRSTAAARPSSSPKSCAASRSIPKKKRWCTSPASRR